MGILGMVFRAEVICRAEDESRRQMSLLDDATTASVSRRRSL